MLFTCDTTTVGTHTTTAAGQSCCPRDVLCLRARIHAQTHTVASPVGCYSRNPVQCRIMRAGQQLMRRWCSSLPLRGRRGACARGVASGRRLMGSECGSIIESASTAPPHGNGDASAFVRQVGGTACRRLSTRQPWHNPALDIFVNDETRGKERKQRAVDGRRSGPVTPFDSLIGVRFPFGTCMVGGFGAEHCTQCSALLLGVRLFISFTWRFTFAQRRTKSCGTSTSTILVNCSLGVSCKTWTLWLATSPMPTAA